MVFVIGSGPAGAAAAYALLKQNIEVTMLDVGEELDTQSEKVLTELYSTNHEAWNPELIARLKGGMRADVSGLPQKRNYGSDYPFRDVGQVGRIEMVDSDVLVSGAKGGLSNVWGANLMPYTSRDLAGWCITAADLSPHYAAVSTFVPMSAGHDDIEEYFPLHTNEPALLRPSRQAAKLMENLKRHRQALRASGFVAGFSRLAVQVKASNANPHGCVYCGLCLYGCPYRLIYSSRDTVRGLEGRGSFHYIPGLIVERLVEHPDHVEIIARVRATGATQKFTAKRVYLACGAIATTRVLLESMQVYDSAVTLKDSQFFLFPMLQYDRTPNVTEESLHTLAQVYLEVFDDSLSARTIQLQFYTYNELYVAAMREKLKFLFPVMKPLLPALLERLCLVMGYLHSDDSASLSLSLKRSTTGAILRITSTRSARTRQVIDGVLRKLWRHRGMLRAFPVKPMMHICEPGKSYHYGGTFPMSKHPGRFESDTWGRPGGFKRIHAVDATVLPGIAATTIVFTAMANAHRIASACNEME